MRIAINVLGTLSVTLCLHAEFNTSCGDAHFGIRLFYSFSFLQLPNFAALGDCLVSLMLTPAVTAGLCL
jgi:hypothetical protein